MRSFEIGLSQSGRKNDEIDGLLSLCVVHNAGRWKSVPRYNLLMPHSFEEVRQIACELPAEQRIQLANSLWESVDCDEGDEAEVEAAWNAEIGRRVAEVKAGTAVTYSLEEVEADQRNIVGP